MKRTDEILITQYEQLRSEIRDKLETMESRMSRGIASGVLITAYSFYTGDHILFSTVPILVGFLIILHMESFTWMIRLSRQICIIQEIVDVQEFNWESKYGMFGTNHLVHGLYSTFSGIAVTIIYVVSIIASLEIAQRPEYTDESIIGYPVIQILEFSYFLLSIFMLLSGAATVVIWRYNKSDHLLIVDDQCPECEGEIQQNSYQINCSDCEWEYPPDRTIRE